LEVFFVEVDGGPEDVDTDVLDVFEREIRLVMEGFGSAASGREGSVDFGFGVAEEGETASCVRPAGDGLAGSEGWRTDDELE